jgi:hypothetical protein
VIHRGGSFNPAVAAAAVVLLPALVIAAGVIAGAGAGGIARAAVPPFTAGRGPHHAPTPAKVVRAAPPPQRQAPELPAAPRRELPGGLQLLFHGLSAEDAAARIARRQQDR